MFFIYYFTILFFILKLFARLILYFWEFWKYCNIIGKLTSHDNILIFSKEKKVADIWDSAPKKGKHSNCHT